MFEGETPVVPSTLYVAAHSTPCTAQRPGTELSGSGYARMPITFEKVSDIQRWNPSQVTSATATANWDAILAFSIWDDLTAGNYYAFGNLTAELNILASKAIVLKAESVIVGLGAAP